MENQDAERRRAEGLIEGILKAMGPRMDPQIRQQIEAAKEAVSEKAERQLPCSDDIFRIACRNPIVKAVLMEWRRNTISWEQALIAMVVHLDQQNTALLKSVYRSLSHGELERFSVQPGDFAPPKSDRGEGKA